MCRSSHIDQIHGSIFLKASLKIQINFFDILDKKINNKFYFWSQGVELFFEPFLYYIFLNKSYLIDTKTIDSDDSDVCWDREDDL